MEHFIDARGKQCPMPVAMAAKAVEGASGGDLIRILVDNETAVNNLSRLAGNKSCTFASCRTGAGDYEIKLGVRGKEKENISEREEKGGPRVVSVGSDRMGAGSDELGRILMKGFLYAVSKLEALPQTILFYNGGARLTAEGSESLEDLKKMEAQGVMILTCGTCLNYYGLTEKLAVGQVTDMYTITEILAGAARVINPS